MPVDSHIYTAQFVYTFVYTSELCAKPPYFTMFFNRGIRSIPLRSIGMKCLFSLIFKDFKRFFFLRISKNVVYICLHYDDIKSLDIDSIFCSFSPLSCKSKQQVWSVVFSSAWPLIRQIASILNPLSKIPEINVFLILCVLLRSIPN